MFQSVCNWNRTKSIGVVVPCTCGSTTEGGNKTLVNARRTCNNVAHQLDMPAALNTGFVVVGKYDVPAEAVVVLVVRADSKAAAAIL